MPTTRALSISLSSFFTDELWGAGDAVAVQPPSWELAAFGAIESEAINSRAIAVKHRPMRRE
jgi:hypothetical protein